MNVVDYLLEQGLDEEIALVDGKSSYTYAQLRAAIDAIGVALAASGAPPGSSVGLLAPNSLLWVAGYLATLKSNLVAVPLSDKATAAELGRALDVSRAPVAIVDRRLLRRTGEVFDRQTPTGPMTVITEEALAEAAGTEPAWPTATDPDSDAVLMFTSGTTDKPKAVRITHRNIAANTDSIIEYLGLRGDDRVLVILPFYYCYGASLLHTHLRQGATVVLCNTFAYPETAIDLIAERECTVFAGVPSSYQLLLRATSYAKRPLPSLRIVQQAGGSLPPVMLEELVAAQEGSQVFVMYGQTEATARLSYLPPDRLADKLGSIGMGIPGVALSVLDEEGEPVPPGERGEIYAVGENISPGYLGDPTGSEAKFTPHGLRTGDLAVVDDDGFIFIVDRRDDFIKTWGYRVSSQAIEATVLALQDLVSAAVVGVPDPAAGEAVVLFVVPGPSATITADQILAHCRSELARHMVPSRVEFLKQLPLNANGKVSKTALREQAAAPVSERGA